MKTLLSTLALLVQFTFGFSQDLPVKNQDDAFMAFNYYPQYTLGHTREEMLQLYPTLKKYKESLIHKKFSYYSPSFSIKNNKVYGYLGMLYVSDQLSSSDNPEKTKLICEKYLKTLAEKLQFEPKIEEKKENSKDFTGTTIDYIWEKDNKKITLREISSYDNKKMYYGFVQIMSSDENLAK